MKCSKCQSENPDTQSFCGDCGTQLILSDDAQPSFTKTLETPVEELTRGTLFAKRYEIIEELGRGGMGKVYRVEDKKISQEIALKLINPGIAADKQTLERFNNELKTARMVSHRNVCRMYDLGEDSGIHFITMEYVRGEDLKSMIRMSGQLGIGTAISISKKICEGLSEAHRLEVIHRDLKPNNIMIDKEGNARIMDFGIARSLKAKGITGSGIMIGTPEYMSPEQVEGKEVDQRSDIYSLGIILYEMLTGRLPFEGDTPFTIGIKHKSEIPEDPITFNSSIPEDLNRLILRCMEKDKENRFQCAEDVRSELERIESGIPTSAKSGIPPKPRTSKEISVSLSPKRLFLPAALILTFTIIGLLIWRPWSQKSPVPIPSGKPSLAILYFENNSGNENLNHWRSGLCEMLITDLSQSKFLQVLSGDRIYSLLDRFDLLDKEKYTTEDLMRIASQGGANHILRGNYITAGETFIINISLLNANTGETIRSLRQEGPGEESITNSVDIITREVKSVLNISPTQIANDIDRDVGMVTTRSSEAYKYYLEGMRYDIKGDYPKVIEYMEKAVAVDPEFASAYHAMSWAYGNQDFFVEADKYIAEALKYSDRLSDREQYLIQGGSYIKSEKTYDKAAQALDKLLQLYPDDISGNNYRGILYTRLGDPEKAAEYFAKCVQNGSEDVIIHINLAGAYKAQGLFDNSRQVLENYLNNISDSAVIRRNLALNFCYQGEYDLALTEIDKAISLNPNSWQNYRTRGNIYLYMNDLKKAEENYRALLEKGEPLAFVWGRVRLASLYMVQGRFKDAIDRGNETLDLAEKFGQSVWIMMSRKGSAYLELKKGNPAKALEEINKALNIAVEDESSSQRDVLHDKGLIYLELNSLNEAQKTADSLKELIDLGINKKPMFIYYHLQGRIELEKKNYSIALEYFQKGLPLISATHDFNIFYADSLGSTFYQGGDLDKARLEYEKLTHSITGKLNYGDIYSKSFYMLGKIYEQQGNTTQAIENYEKFLTLWKDADPGIVEVDDARERVAALDRYDSRADLPEKIL